MTIILLVLNLLLNTTETVVTNDAGRAKYSNSCEFVIMDEDLQ